MINNPHILVNRPEGCCLTDPNTKSGVDLLIWLWKSSTTESKPNPEPHGPDQILVVHFKAQAGPAKFDQFHCYNNTQHSQAAQKIDNVPRVSDLNSTDKTPMTVMSLTFVLGVNGTECVWGLEGSIFWIGVLCIGVLAPKFWPKIHPFSWYTSIRWKECMPG